MNNNSKKAISDKLDRLIERHALPNYHGLMLLWANHIQHQPVDMRIWFVSDVIARIPTTTALEGFCEFMDHIELTKIVSATTIGEHGNLYYDLQRAIISWEGFHQGALSHLLQNAFTLSNTMMKGLLSYLATLSSSDVLTLMNVTRCERVSTLLASQLSIMCLFSDTTQKPDMTFNLATLRHMRKFRLPTVDTALPDEPLIIEKSIPKITQSGVLTTYVSAIQPMCMTVNYKGLSLETLSQHLQWICSTEIKDILTYCEHYNLGQLWVNLLLSLQDTVASDLMSLNVQGRQRAALMAYIASRL